MKISQVIYVIARWVSAVILMQTLYFKFTAAEESVYIFTTIGMEPWGRIAVGIFELIASILLIVPRTVWAGSLLAFGLMAGALVMHLTLLGIEVMGDGGQLFIYALIVAVCTAWLFVKSTHQLPLFIYNLLPSFLKQGN